MSKLYRSEFEVSEAKGFKLETQVEIAVRNAPGYYDGEVESLKARVNKLTEILQAVVSVLPEEVQDDVAKKLYLTPVKSA